MPIPKAIQNAPALLLGLDVYLIAFWDLTGTRQLGMSVGPISWITVQTYSEVMGMDEDQTLDMHYHVSCLDTAWLAHGNKPKGGASGKS